ILPEQIQLNGPLAAIEATHAERGRPRRQAGGGLVGKDREPMGSRRESDHLGCQGRLDGLTILIIENNVVPRLAEFDIEARGIRIAPVERTVEAIRLDDREFETRVRVRRTAPAL